MLNNTGIKGPYNYDKPVQILENVEFQLSVGCIVPQALGTTVTSNGRTFKIAKAGTPIKINFGNLNAVAQVPSNDVYPFTSYDDDQGTTQLATGTVGILSQDEVANQSTVVVLTNSVEGFVGKKYVIDMTEETLDAGTFYQLYEVDGTATGMYVKVGTKSSTGVAGNAVLLHNVDVTNGNNNGTALIWGFVNINRLEDDVAAKVAAGNNTVGQVTFLNA